MRALLALFAVMASISCVGAFSVAGSRLARPAGGVSLARMGPSSASRGGTALRLMGGDEERELRTVENEPEEYFATNLDRKTDAEKIPYAIGAIVFISLPFIVGFVALSARS